MVLIKFFLKKEKISHFIPKFTGINKTITSKLFIAKSRPFSGKIISFTNIRAAIFHIITKRNNPATQLKLIISG